MRTRDKNPGDEILFARLHAGAAFTAATLRAIGRQRHALDVAQVGDGNDHILALDQILVFHLAFLIDDQGPARRRELVLDGRELRLDDRLDARARAQDFEIVGDLDGELVELLLDFVAAEGGQALQAQIEDRARLLLGKPRRAGRRYAMPRIVNQLDQRGRCRCRPLTRHQCFACRIRIGRGADEVDHFIDIGDGNRKADQDVGTIACFVEEEFGAPRHHLLAKGDEYRQQILQRHHLRPAGIERDHVGAEGGLQRGKAIKLVEHDVRHGVAAEFDHHAIPVAVGFVAQVGDALDLPLAYQLADLLDHRGLVHLVRDFGDDDGFALAPQRFDRVLATHDD